MVHYLPHHGVIRQDHATTKLRIVYDGSARLARDDCSLNDCLQVGPNFIPKLFNILIKFRSHPIAITSDIEKAFLMISISRVDRDVLRFLWFEDPTNPNSNVIHFRFARLVFGLRSSPAVLGAVISNHLKSYNTLYPTVKEQVGDCLYVDDLITGASTVEQGFELYQMAKRIMKDAGLNLRKWNSNSTSLMKQISEAESMADSNCPIVTSKVLLSEEEESYSKSSVGLLHSVSKTEHSKLLGVIWDSQGDQLMFKFHDLINYANTLPLSKRSVLKISAKIFDPLGLLGPFVIRLKMMFRKLCLEKVEWDDLLRGDLLSQWKSILMELGTLSDIRIDRCYFIMEATPVDIQLHGFCDASIEAYAAVVYLRVTYSDDSVKTTILASKTRVAPLKVQTIPRMELLSAVILARFITTIKDILSSLKISKLFLWTDSVVVLCWLLSSKPCRQYVSSRVNEIHRLINKDVWHHCPGSLNPADMPSRGIKGSELLCNTVWWKGPQFLQLTETEWPCTVSTENSEEAQAEFLKNPPEVAYTLTSMVSSLSNLIKVSNAIDCTQFSDLHKLLLVTTFVLRFVKRCRGHNGSSGHHTQSLVKEIKEAELHWIKGIQQESFQAEIRYLHTSRAPKPPLVDQFGLFIDDN